jgi:hypothetical protein
MAKGQRSHKRSKAILDYIRVHFPEDGPDAVAFALGESKGYIVNKANHHKILYKGAVVGRPAGTSLEREEIKRLSELVEGNKAAILGLKVKLKESRRECHKHELKILDQLGQLDRVKADYNKEHEKSKELRGENIVLIGKLRACKKKLGLLD